MHVHVTRLQKISSVMPQQSVLAEAAHELMGAFNPMEVFNPEQVRNIFGTAIVAPTCAMLAAQPTVLLW